MTLLLTIKKYLFLVALGLFVVTLGHVVVLYLYHDSHVFPEAGGTLNVGFVGETPTLNPAEYGIDSTNDLLLRFLFRSMLRHDIATNEIVGDLGNCDLGKNFGLIRCYLAGDNSLWSDGSPITKDDVLATYDFLRTSDVNHPIQKILEQVDISDQGEYIEFHAKNADVVLLDLFMVPIMKKEKVANLRAGRVSLDGYVSSGPYLVSKSASVDSKISKNVTLVRNDHYQDPTVYIGKYVFRFFSDKNALTTNEDSLNIIYSLDRADTPKSPRFSLVNYILPQYLALFLNSESIPLPLRNLILFQLSSYHYTPLDPTQGRSVGDVFFSDSGSGGVTLGEKNLAKIFSDLGYYKKDGLVNVVHQETKANLAPTIVPKPVANNAYIQSPTNQPIFFFSGSDTNEIVISGTVPEGVDAVYMNNFKLGKFNTGDTTFLYRARPDIGNLQEGGNTYTLSFERGGNREVVDTLAVYYITDPAALAAKQAEVLSGSTVEKPLPSTTVATVTNSGTKAIETIASLDPNFYYNKAFNRYTLRLVYSNQSPFMDALVHDVSEALGQIGIAVEKKELDANGFRDMVSKDEKKYDILLTGIHLGLLSYNVFPFFHSGQAKVGLNFSKIKNVMLDGELEKLKSSHLAPDELKGIEGNILSILKTENVVKTYYSPYNSFYIDRNVVGVRHEDILPYPSYLFDLVRNAYIKKGRTLSWSDKGIMDFMRFVRSYL